GTGRPAGPRQLRVEPDLRAAALAEAEDHGARGVVAPPDVLARRDARGVPARPLGPARAAAVRAGAARHTPGGAGRLPAVQRDLRPAAVPAGEAEGEGGRPRRPAPGGRGPGARVES